MAAALAQPPNNHLNKPIPHAIYQPLLDIAQRGYKATDVLKWYIAMQQTLYDTETVNYALAYSITPPFSVCSPAPQDPNAQLFENEPASPLEATASAQSPYDAAQTGVGLWSDPSPFDNSAGPQLEVSTPTSTHSHHVPRLSISSQGAVTQMPHQWPQAAVAFPEASFSDLSTPRNETPDPNWLDSATLSTLNSVSRKRSASQPLDCESAMSAAVPSLFVPSESYSLRDTPSFYPFPTSTDLAQRPQITVIPSRKRRRTKGVKNIIPLPLQYQST